MGNVHLPSLSALAQAGPEQDMSGDSRRIQNKAALTIGGCGCSLLLGMAFVLSVIVLGKAILFAWNW